METGSSRKGSSCNKKNDLVWACGGSLEAPYSHSKRFLSDNKWSKLLYNANIFENYFDAYSQCVLFNTNGFVINRNIFNDIGLFNENLKQHEDIDLAFRVAYKYPRVGFAWPPTTIRYERPGSLSSNYYQDTNMVLLLEKHLGLARSYGDEVVKRFLPDAKHLAQISLVKTIDHNDKKALKIMMKDYSYLLGNYKLAGWVTLYIPVNIINILRTICRPIKLAVKFIIKPLS